MEPLGESLTELKHSAPNPETILVVLSPISTLDFIEHIPKGKELVDKLIDIVKTIFRYEPSQVKRPFFYNFYFIFKFYFQNKTLFLQKNFNFF